MKKIVFTLSAIALFLTANAQDKKVENWPNGNKKSEGVIIGNPVDASASKEVQQRQAVNAIRDGKWSNYFEKLFKKIKALKLPFDQMIDEFGFRWVHVSYDLKRQRGQILQAKKDAKGKTIYIQPNL